MTRAGSSFFTVTDRPPPPGTRPGMGPTIIWLRGEHDIATDPDLRRTLDRAISLNNAPIVIDLSKVELMSASTLGIIVVAWNTLRQQSRSLTMRSPSPHVRRVISICGLHNLLSSEQRDDVARVPQKGLGPLEVPDYGQGGRQPGASTVKRVPVHVGQAAAWREPGPDEMPT
jgi:anti-anti-sigma factor